jgi:hypothetical protein
MTCTGCSQKTCTEPAIPDTALASSPSPNSLCSALTFTSDCPICAPSHFPLYTLVWFIHFLFLILLSLLLAALQFAQKTSHFLGKRSNTSAMPSVPFALLWFSYWVSCFCLDQPGIIIFLPPSPETLELQACTTTTNPFFFLIQRNYEDKNINNP